MLLVDLYYFNYIYLNIRFKISKSKKRLDILKFIPLPKRLKIGFCQLVIKEQKKLK